MATLSFYLFVKNMPNLVKESEIMFIKHHKCFNNSSTKKGSSILNLLVSKRGVSNFT